MPLRDTKIRNAKPAAKSYKLFDGEGLYLEVSPSGGKWWRLKYRFNGKEKRVSLGVYPDVSLREARIRRAEARAQRARGVDPSHARKLAKLAQYAAAGDTFEAVASEWFAKRTATWASTHSSKIKRRLERDLFPWVGRRPIAEITAAEMLAVLVRIEKRGAIETAHRAMQNASQVFRYAIASGRATSDPTRDLRGALAPVTPSHHASITDPEQVGKLLRAIDGYEGQFVTKCALKLAPLVFVRPGELRRAEWSEFRLDAAEWRIPAERMKMKEPHIVPLSRQAVAVLRELHPLTGECRYVFTGARDTKRPMSENTVNAALRRLGYGKDEMTGHGFRSMASTILNEQGWPPDVIERQLAHKEGNNVRAAYNYARHLDDRKRMMQAWADYLDTLAQANRIPPVRHRSRQKAL